MHCRRGNNNFALFNLIVHITNINNVMIQLSTGSLLHGGTYIIENSLGQGSFGITYLATHTALERKVAIKEFFMKELNSRGEDGSITGMTDGSLSYNYGQKFKKEALNLARLDHPNIVRVTDSFEENGTYYYVMDYIEGQNLNDYLKQNSVSQQEAVSIITDVAKALMYMHDEKHMLHLDLKPGNIMRRSSDGHVFLIDFGLSKHYSNNGQPETSTTIGLGTPGYAPIEQSNQAKNGEFRPTIDVYALGATLFKLLTRETPPPASDIVSDDELVEDKLRANGIIGSIIKVVTNAMLPNVRKRIQTVKAFIASLPDSLETSSLDISSLKDNDEETMFVTVPSSNREETEIIGSKNISHTNFDESTYIINQEYKRYPTSTGGKANAGDVEAILAIGMMALRGDGLAQDSDMAYSWFVKLKDLGDNRGNKLISDWNKLKDKYKKTSKDTTSSSQKIRWNSQDPSKLDLSWHDNIGLINKGVLWGAVLTIIFGVIGGFTQIHELGVFFTFFLFIIPSIILGILGIRGAISIEKRKPNAVFLCLVYSWICIITNIAGILVSLSSGEFPGIWVFIWIGYGVSILIALYCSDDINLIYPKEYRKASTIDKALAGICITAEAIIFLLCLIGLIV